MRRGWGSGGAALFFDASLVGCLCVLPWYQGFEISCSKIQPARRSVAFGSPIQTGHHHCFINVWNTQNSEVHLVEPHSVHTCFNIRGASVLLEEKVRNAECQIGRSPANALAVGKNGNEQSFVRNPHGISGKSRDGP